MEANNVELTDLTNVEKAELNLIGILENIAHCWTV